MADRDSILNAEFDHAIRDYLRHISQPYIEDANRLVQQFIDTEREHALRAAKLLLLGQFRASTPSPSVTPYWPPPEELPPGVLGRRVACLHSWLINQEIPQRDWHRLTEHGHTLKSIYDALKVYPEFKSEQGRGKSITLSVFRRKFWQEQRLAKIAPA